MENFSKKGRPPLIPEYMKGVYSSLYEEYRGRSLRNQWHAGTVFAWFKDVPGLEWLFETRANGNYKRHTLHYELGLFPDPESAYQAALTLCKDKPRVRTAVANIRRWRKMTNGKETQRTGDALQLTDELINAVNDYIDRWPDTTDKQVLAALENTIHAVETRNEL